MRNRPFIAARVEKKINRWTEKFFRRFRWRDAIIAYTGYGNEHQMRVLARVVIFPSGARGLDPAREQAWTRRRGWRNLYRQPAVNRAVQIHVGEAVTHALTTRDGYVDISVANHGLPPGWHHVTITTADSAPTQVPVLIISDQTRFGIISDIDDTILTSFLPRPLVAVYNALIPTEASRVPVAGMAAMYTAILREHPGSPLIYVSTGAWNTQPFLERFVARHGFPPGPMLLSDWGPTNTGWFRSGPAHKMRALESLVRDFPSIRWLLVGDDGQRDPLLYARLAHLHPNNVAAIAIRQLPIMEQVLAHGTMTEMDDPSSPHIVARGVRAPDGNALLPLVEKQLQNLE